VSRPPGARQLQGARAKLQRAAEHLGQLMAAHERFIHERNPYRMLLEHDAEPGYNLWRVKIVEFPPLAKRSSLTGECVHALRSALDHTAFELVQINRPGTDYAEFPIIKDEYVRDTTGATITTEATITGRAGMPKLPVGCRWTKEASRRQS
jgi:hypothetical protein